MSRSPRRPLEQVLVDRGHAASLEHARSLVAAGRVVVGGAPATSPTRAVARGEQVRVLEPPRFVGRGGEKLDGALDALGIDAAGRLALDVGASTGGFTDCLLARTRRAPLAVDVGRHQLHERLRADERVVAMEGTNVRDLDLGRVAEALGGAPSLVVADLAFTSLRPHAATIVAVSADRADLVVLVKPQFEVDRATASRGRGVVTDPTAWRTALLGCASSFEAAGAGIMGAVAAPLAGASGNVEFFLHAVTGAGTPPGIDARIEMAVAAAATR